jgi:ribosome hibernation promoting factor
VDLVLKGRGFRITDQVRRSAEHKLSKVSRFDPSAFRMEVEIHEEKPRIEGGYRVEVACFSGRKTFRAEGTGTDVSSALDRVVERLERQITRHRGKLRTRSSGRSNRIQSFGTSAKEARNPE